MSTWILALLLAITVREAYERSPCPPEGKGGDPILNRLKNRTESPRKAQPMQVPAFLRELTPDLDAPKFRNKFTPAQKQYVEVREKKAVALEGYLLDARQSGVESCNCHIEEARDFHLWLGARPPADRADAKAMRAQAVVVEPSPRGQMQNSNWRLRIFQKLARTGAKVRVTGWLMYDPEHAAEMGKTRGTLWELHPVSKFEVWSDGRYRDLQDEPMQQE